eukprot:9774287-Alexandrium_andersonii.AAC.1
MVFAYQHADADRCDQDSLVCMGRKQISIDVIKSHRVPLVETSIDVSAQRQQVAAVVAAAHA